MKLERSNIDFPLWRKKVDKSLFDYSGTTIKDWDYFRYDVLPRGLADFRLTLESMMIRSFAAVLGNKKNIDTLDMGKYRLANDKIDL